MSLDFLSRLFGGGDPAAQQAIDPVYGIPKQVLDNQRGMALLQNGLTLLAAGQRQSPENRANLIAQSAGAFKNVFPSAEDTMRMKLWNAQAQKAQQDAQKQAILLRSIGVGGPGDTIPPAPVTPTIGGTNADPVNPAGTPANGAAPVSPSAGPASMPGATQPGAMPGAMPGQPPQITPPEAFNFPTLEQYDPGAYKRAMVFATIGTPQILQNYTENYKSQRDIAAKQHEATRQRFYTDQDYYRKSDDDAAKFFTEKQVMPAYEMASKSRDALVATQAAREMLKNPFYANTITEQTMMSIARIAGIEPSQMARLRNTEELSSTLARIVAGRYAELAGGGQIALPEQSLAQRIAGRSPTGEPLTREQVEGALLATERGAKERLVQFKTLMDRSSKVRGFDRYAPQFAMPEDTPPAPTTPAQTKNAAGVVTGGQNGNPAPITAMPTPDQFRAAVAANPAKREAYLAWAKKYGYDTTGM